MQTPPGAGDSPPRSVPDRMPVREPVWMLPGPGVSSSTALRTVRPQEQGGSLQGPKGRKACFRLAGHPEVQMHSGLRTHGRKCRPAAKTEEGKHTVSQSHSPNPAQRGPRQGCGARRVPADGVGPSLAPRAATPQGEASSTQG